MASALDVFFPVVLCLGAIVVAAGVYALVATVKTRRAERLEQRAAQGLRSKHQARGKHVR